MEKAKIHNVIILDRSGSMESIRRQAVSGVNETVQAIRHAQEKDPMEENTLTLVAFCSCSMQTIYDDAPIGLVEPLALEDYQPCCATPLLDAIGTTVIHVHNLTAGRPRTAVAVTIITDDHENASREFSGKAVKDLIEARKEEGWLFTYIGADQDVKAVGRQMSIDNTLSFECSCTGTEAMFRKERNARRGWLDKLSKLNDINLTEAERMEIKRESSTNYFDLTEL